MDRETVLAIAKQCGHWSGETVEMNDVGIERFYNLIHDHLTYSSIHSCHPGCTKPACVAMRKAVEAEREACASVALTGTGEAVQLKTLEIIRAERERIADAIRNRSN